MSKKNLTTIILVLVVLALITGCTSQVGKTKLCIGCLDEEGFALAKAQTDGANSTVSTDPNTLTGTANSFHQTNLKRAAVDKTLKMVQDATKKGKADEFNKMKETVDKVLDETSVLDKAF